MRFSVEKPVNDPVMVFVMMILHSVTNAHILHFRAPTLSIHKALGEYYEEVGDLLDSFVESFQGKYGLLTKYTADYSLPVEALEYMHQLKDQTEELRRMKGFPQDSELQNEVDSIANLINTTIYKLTYLK